MTRDTTHTDTAPGDTGTERWAFTARPGEADRAYLVLDDGGPSRWIEMQPVPGQAGAWDAAARLTAGRYRVRYFIATGGTFINCGDTGLSARHIEGRCPGVRIEPFSVLAA